MPFRFAWKDDSRRVMCYIAKGDWNWRDYHHAARASSFTLAAIDHPVDRLIDLRASSRPTLPAGMLAHLRSFNRLTQACLTGRALVIGVKQPDLANLQLEPDNTLSTADGIIKFVNDVEEMEQTLREWGSAD